MLEGMVTWLAETTLGILWVPKTRINAFEGWKEPYSLLGGWFDPPCMLTMEFCKQFSWKLLHCKQTFKYWQLIWHKLKPISNFKLVESFPEEEKSVVCSWKAQNISAIKRYLMWNQNNDKQFISINSESHKELFHWVIISPFYTWNKELLVDFW